MAARDVKFLVDVMLGKLAKWLRILGYDAVYVPNGSDEVLIGKARAEGRILLTRDTGLLEKLHPGKGCFVPYQRPADQLHFVVKTFHLDPDEEAFFSRCLVCNREVEEIGKSKVAGKVPPEVYESHAAFVWCPECGRIYWPGSHYRNAERRLREILKG